MEELQFPYGDPNFYRVITENYVYIDRTDRIPYLERVGKTLLFLRPRRFGKSMLLSMLENYYDVKKTDAFERLFGHLAIGQKPTSLHNQYLTLWWDFSVVDTSGDSQAIKRALYGHINACIKDFKMYYRDILEYDIEVDLADALVSFQSLLTVVRTTPYKLYLFIDEYDNFANEVLMTHEWDGEERYRELVEGEGIIKTLFKTIKYSFGRQELERIFITGVSPVLANDITSGFNIVENITLDPHLYDICGFREEEVVEMLNRVTTVRSFSEQQTQEALTMMRTFYNGYRFIHTQEHLIYNSTLALFFLKQLLLFGEYPTLMLDGNLATDSHKIAYIARLPNGTQVISAALNEDETEPLSIMHLANRFGVRDILYNAKDATYMVSLLHYLGVLTLTDRYTATGKIIFAIPNLVTRSLYVEQIRNLLLTTGSDLDEATDVANTFYSTGDMGNVCDFIERKYFKVFDNRDYRWTNELTIKTIFLTLLFNDSHYMMSSELVLQRRYSDLVMLVRPDMRQFTLYDFLIEFKYIKLPTIGLSAEEIRIMSIDDVKGIPIVQTRQLEAQKKLANYRQILHDTYGDTLRLRCFSVVSIGYERLVWWEMV